MTDTIRTSPGWVLQQLIEAQLTATIGAEPHDPTDTAPPSATGAARS